MCACSLYIYRRLRLRAVSSRDRQCPLLRIGTHYEPLTNINREEWGYRELSGLFTLLQSRLLLLKLTIFCAWNSACWVSLINWSVLSRQSAWILSLSLKHGFVRVSIHLLGVFGCSRLNSSFQSLYRVSNDSWALFSLLLCNASFAFVTIASNYIVDIYDKIWILWLKGC